jgi:hypothetical protein
MKISLKELRETYNCLRLIKRKNWYQEEKIGICVDENNQLISIFVRSIETAQKNNKQINSQVKKERLKLNSSTFISSLLLVRYSSWKH